MDHESEDESENGNIWMSPLCIFFSIGELTKEKERPDIAVIHQ